MLLYNNYIVAPYICISCLCWELASIGPYGKTCVHIVPQGFVILCMYFWCRKIYALTHNITKKIWRDSMRSVVVGGLEPPPHRYIRPYSYIPTSNHRVLLPEMDDGQWFRKETHCFLLICILPPSHKEWRFWLSDIMFNRSSYSKILCKL